MFTGSVLAYSDPHPEVTTVDGYVQHIQSLDWAVLRAAAGSGHSDTSISLIIGVTGASTLNKWWSIYRSILLFPTANTVPADATITGATLALWGRSIPAKPASWSPSLGLYPSLPASNTDIVNGDFATLGDTPLATALPYASWVSGGWNILTLTPAGLAAIARDDITKFGLREATYDGANVEPTWEGNTGVSWQLCSADAGAAGENAPVLRINYSLETDHSASIVTLQAIRQMEMTTMGRFYIDESGNARFEGRLARNP